MTILSRFIKLLEWLETAQDFFLFLTQPVGFSLASALCLFFPVQILGGCDSLTAATLSSTAALALFCLSEKPSF